jgi:hypothetical protein
MILVTSMMTGLFAAMLRSAFAVIIVAFLIAVLFAVAFVFYDASLFSLALSLIGFNVGLVLYGAVHIAASGSRSAS